MIEKPSDRIGARRVPLPVISQVEGLDTKKLAGPIPSSSNTISTAIKSNPATLQREKPAAPKPVSSKHLTEEKLKNLPPLNRKPSGSTITSVTTDRIKPPNNASSNSGIGIGRGQVGCITQPTQSQPSCPKSKVAIRKTEEQSNTKPVWGRPVLRKANTTKKLPASGKIQEQRKIITVRSCGADRPGTDTECLESNSDHMTMPGLTPLPPTPTHDPTKEAILEIGDEGAAFLGEHDCDRNLISENPGDATKKSPAVGSDTTASVSLRPETLGGCDKEPHGNVVATERSPVPSVMKTGSEPATPLVLPSRTSSVPPLEIDSDVPLLSQASPTRTPISTLVSSIQRGFLFTPSSPLSPPQSYLPIKVTPDVLRDLAIPFPLRAHTLELDIDANVHNDDDDQMNGDIQVGVPLDFMLRKARITDAESNWEVLGEIEVNK